MKKVIFVLIGIMFSSLCFAQNNIKNTEGVFRIMLISPGIEIELPTFNKSLFTVTLGVGSEGAYKNLAEDPSEPYYHYYFIAPFFDVRYKNIYNLEKRKANAKNTNYNTGNYFGARFLIRGPEIYSGFERTDNIDLSLGPIWGIQRSYGIFYLQLDVGPMYYFDTKGNSGIFPVMIDLSIGFNIKKF